MSAAAHEGSKVARGGAEVAKLDNFDFQVNIQFVWLRFNIFSDVWFSPNSLNTPIYEHYSHNLMLWASKIELVCSNYINMLNVHN